MKHFEITHIIDNAEWESKLENLSKRCKRINGWTDADLLQFAVNAMPFTNVYLEFLDLKIKELEHSII